MIRPSRDEDIVAFTAIHGHHVLTGTGTFEIAPTEAIGRAAGRVGVRTFLAVVGDFAYAGSIGVHTALGFSHVGVLKSCGWRFDRWLDAVTIKSLWVQVTAPLRNNQQDEKQNNCNLVGFLDGPSGPSPLLPLRVFRHAGLVAAHSNSTGFLWVGARAAAGPRRHAQLVADPLVGIHNRRLRFERHCLRPEQH